MDNTARAYTGKDFADLSNEATRARFDAVNLVSEWPDPDLSIMRASRRDAVPMPTALFGPALPLLEALAEGTSTPLDYAGGAFLAASASLIGGKRRVRPYATANWAEPAILWVGIVGEPSSRKSPALDAVVDPLRVLERDGAEAHRQNLQAWREADATAKANRADWERALARSIREGNARAPAMPAAAIAPEEPHRRRTMVMDATPEAVASILAGNRQGTLHVRDELAGWLQSFDRYSPGGREFWLEAYGGRSFVVDRKGAQGPLMIPFNGVSVVGGIQPAKMADSLLASPDDGLVARFLWCWPDKLPHRRPARAGDLAALEAAYRRLELLSWGQSADGDPCAVTLPLSTDAADLFAAWEADNGEADDDASGLFKSFVGKMNGAVLRLALVAEMTAWAFRGGAEPQEVSVESLAAAAAWVDDYAKPMAQRVYGDAALPPPDRNAAILARYIVKQGLRTINKRALKRSPHKSALPTMRDAKALDAALEVLIDGGWIKHAGGREGETIGRATGDYAVNPAVFRGRE